MASSAEMQRRAAEKRRAARKPLLGNTTSWVDESYGKLLCAQLRKDIVKQSHETLDRLQERGDYSVSAAALQRWPGYIWHCDEGALLISLGADVEQTLVLITVGIKGGRARPNLRGMSILLSDHFVARMFERLRTNHRDDVLAMMKYLCVAELPEGSREGDTFELETPYGSFHLESVVRTYADGGFSCPTWLVKTWIGAKK